MTEALTHRGPDAEGYYVSKETLLGHRRLIVVDPSGGQQPMTRQQGNRRCVIVYNGELYNTEAIRQDLLARGYSFRAYSDTEVLLTAFMEWGPDCLERLNGIFAFAIWDETAQTLFMARDRLGVKPLFYTQQRGRLLFASELKSLLAHRDIEPVIDPEGLAEVVALGPARTPGHGVFHHIHEVRAGYCLTYTRLGLQTLPYWQVQSRPHEDDLITTVANVRNLLGEAVERQLVSDVPVCTLLSGGLDSSALTALTVQTYRREGRGTVPTFSVDYRDNDRYFQTSLFQPNADAPWIQHVSAYLGTEHQHVMIDTPQLVEALLPAMQGRDLPGMADVDASLLLFCREIKKHATVALSGECADEIFGGYPWFHQRQALEAAAFPWARTADNKLRCFSSELRQTLQPEAYMARRYEETIAEVPRLPGEDPVEARRREMFYLNIQWFMANLLDRKDRMSMATGLEVRVPFCDHHLLEYVWNIPWSMKMYNGREKGVLRLALQGLLPEDVIWRKKSPYPKTHHPAYFMAVRDLLRERLLDGSSPLLPLLNRPVINQLMVSDPLAGVGDPWFGQLMSLPQLFAYLIQMDDWMRTYKIRLI
ncbi:asparagine synthase (glutamine-hydrolysing) [Heliophilum fasciatum]|uniref:asparagine synthase (glutamine-hydrolyzing) n=2 Tax=Heliophilum fasciatum TaxID=35700 RepID=A0A4R2RIX3_9FIRM|nr:asparagine synthase (glutamine-hydrolysing) [Heliophilum fasciatum]